MMNYYYPNHMFFGGFGLFGLFWDILVIWLVIAILSRVFGHRGHFRLKPRSLEILKRRYAKGKITKKQFEEMKKDIE